MLTVEDALERVLADVPLLSAEQVPLHEAYGRVLAEDIIASEDIPRWNNSAMDGYAVRAADTDEGEVVLRLNEVVPGGGAPTMRVEEGTATMVMTGAPLPEGADAVVRIEDTDGAFDDEVRIYGPVKPGQYVREQGQDVRRNELVLRAGRRLRPSEVGMAAALGLPTLFMVRRPVVALLGTGNELVMPGRDLGPGQIYAANNASLGGLVEEAGGVVLDAGIAPDDIEGLLARLDYCADQADVVVTTGGVSVGAFDLVREAHQRLGLTEEFWKVRLKPGMPLSVGRLVRETVPVQFFGLPGNPVSCMVTFLQFVRPYLLRAMGVEHAFLPMVQARLAADFVNSSDRNQLVRVTIEDGEDGLWAWVTGSQSSGVLTSMVQAHGLMLLSPDRSVVRAGTTVTVQVIDHGFGDRTQPGYIW